MVSLVFACWVLGLSLHSLLPHPGILFATALISKGACNLRCSAFMPFSITLSSFCEINCWLGKVFSHREGEVTWGLKPLEDGKFILTGGANKNFPALSVTPWSWAVGNLDEFCFNWSFILMSLGKFADTSDCVGNCVGKDLSEIFQPDFSL